MVCVCVCGRVVCVCVCVCVSFFLYNYHSTAPILVILRGLETVYGMNVEVVGWWPYVRVCLCVWGGGDVFCCMGSFVLCDN